jgi:TonB family protein
VKYSFLCPPCLAFLICLTSISAPAQVSSAAASNPLSQAIQSYGLESPDTGAWHIKATYESFDEMGQPKGQGTYEEFWAGPKQYKRSYTSPNFTQTDYGTEKGILRSGAMTWAGTSEMRVRQNLINPLPSESEVKNAVPELIDWPVGYLVWKCVRLSHAGLPRAVSVYCFSSDKPILRFESLYGDSLRASFEEVSVFKGRNIARSINVISQGKPLLNIHLDTIEELTQVNAADFLPPSDAVAPPLRKIPVSSGVMQGLLLEKKAPAYPDGAKKKHIEGTVVLASTIGEDGHVQELKVISSPDEDLSKAAMDAVGKWVYKPFLLNGEAVVVQTQVNIVFRLAN